MCRWGKQGEGSSTILCRIVVFYLKSSIHNSARNCCLLLPHPPTFLCRIVFFYIMSIHISVDNCHFQPLVHYKTGFDNSAQNCHLLPLVHPQFCAELSSSTSGPFHNCRKAGAGDGGEVHSSSSSQWRPRRTLPPKPHPRNPKSLLLHLVCLFLPCLLSSFFGFFMVWSFSDHVVSSVLYISW